MEINKKLEHVNKIIFTGKNLIISFKNVQHIEKHYHQDDSGPDAIYQYKKDDLSGIFVITKHTTWNFEHDVWENASWIGEYNGEASRFITEYHQYCCLLEELEIKRSSNSQLEPGALG